MTSYSFKLPDLGEGMIESEIVEWQVQIGEWVDADQPVVDMMTDKATIEITAPVSGRVVSLAGDPGDMISVGGELMVFDTDSDTRPQTLIENDSKTTKLPTAEAVQDDVQEQTAPLKKPLTSPAIRRLAREHNIDLTQLSGTGPNGRITRNDIDRALNKDDQSQIRKQELKQGVKREIKVIGLRRKIAEQMSLSVSHIPHFTYVEEIDITELELLRKQLNSTRGQSQPKLTYIPFFMLVLVKVLKDFPQCNARFDDDNQIITQYDDVHIGIATQTDNGLMVPVVKHAEALDLWNCAEEVRRVTEDARSGKANKTDLGGSTITISSLGALGGITTTPIINYPEVAVIGVNKANEKPIIVNGTVTRRLIMNLSSSFDHRVVDGYDAARMIQAMKLLIECPALIFI
jgi:2-oxoisovalerate dehydrogenase E2 component (dihydrolipoyl transacylase)